MTTDDVIAEVTSEAGDVHWLVHITAGRHGLLSDAPEAEGGGAKGPGPFTYVLAGLVACTSGTLRMFAEDPGDPGATRWHADPDRDVKMGQDVPLRTSSAASRSTKASSG